MSSMNKIRPSTQALARRTSIHTYRHRDGIPRTTFSTSGGWKNVNPSTSADRFAQSHYFLTYTICMRKWNVWPDWQQELWCFFSCTSMPYYSISLKSILRVIIWSEYFMCRLEHSFKKQSTYVNIFINCNMKNFKSTSLVAYFLLHFFASRIKIVSMLSYWQYENWLHIFAFHKHIRVYISHS
jgi:hypothetical protein